MSNTTIRRDSSITLAAPPHRTYLICSTPRTGSTQLATALEATGLAGRPAEYFDIHERNEDVWRARLGVVDEAEYLDRAVCRATTSNGVCGLKLHRHQADRLRIRLSPHSGHRDVFGLAPSLADLLRRKFGRVRHVWVRRRNKIAQGISYCLAASTGVGALPRNGSAPARLKAAPKFDLLEIHRYVELCTSFDHQWEAYFRDNGIAPLTVVYENFVESYAATVRGVLSFIGLPGLENMPISPPRLEQQASALSREWEQRYRAAMAPNEVATSLELAQVV